MCLLKDSQLTKRVYQIIGIHSINFLHMHKTAMTNLANFLTKTFKNVKEPTQENTLSIGIDQSQVIVMIYNRFQRG